MGNTDADVLVLGGGLVGTAVGAVKEEARDAHLGGRKAKGDIGLREGDVR